MEELIVEKEIIEGYRLSPPQRRLWLLQQRESALPFRVQCAVRIEGLLDEGLMRVAVQNVVDRHAILRTSFRAPDGDTVPLQVISDIAALAWNSVNLSDYDEREQQDRIESLYRQIGQHQFDFEHAPLLQLSFLTLSDCDFILLLCLPALCADGAALENLVAEISLSYAACAEGEKLNGETTQYVQFSEWLNELLLEETAAEGENFWDEQEIFASSSLTLPFEEKGEEQLQSSLLFSLPLSSQIFARDF